MNEAGRIEQDIVSSDPVRALCDSVWPSHVQMERLNTWYLGECFLVDIGSKDLCSFFGEGFGRGASNALRCRRNQRDFIR